MDAGEPAILRSNKSKEVTLTNRDNSREVFKVNEIVTLEEISDIFWTRFRGISIFLMS